MTLSQLVHDPYVIYLAMALLGLIASAFRERTRESHPGLSSWLALAVRFLPAAMFGAAKHLAPQKPATPTPGSVEEYVMRLAIEAGAPVVATVEERPTAPEEKKP